jgi:two-component system cell cycle response regulator
MTAQLTSLMSRRRDNPMSALLVDIDHFKKVNDGYGHDVGDEVLREFAVRLANNVRTVDLACRYGGEEFVVLMPDTELIDAHAIAERIRHDVAGTPFSVNGGRDLLRVTISIGVAVAGPQDGADSLLKRADEAVYRAKAEGRNRVIAKAA